MKRCFAIFCLGLFITVPKTTFGQTSEILENINLNKPKDSILSKALMQSIENFYNAAQKPNVENNYVLPSDKMGTYLLLDELQGIEKSGRFKNNNFYKPYITSLVPIDSMTFLVKLQNVVIHEQIPVISSSFEFLAHKSQDTVLFSSTLKRNTVIWKKMQKQNTTIYYKEKINKKEIDKYLNLVTLFDKKLENKPKATEIYLCSDYVEAQKLIGVDYKIIYNGQKYGTLSAHDKNQLIICSGNGSSEYLSFDPHDLWHDRLSLKKPRNQVNKPVDEGCSYLYGGSWGISWWDIFVKFKTKVCKDKSIDWLSEYGKFANFGDTQETHLMAEYVINALIVQKIEKEKGFDGVWELLDSGPYDKTGEKYFATLEKLTGINKSNFNDKVWELINTEKQ